MDFFTKNKMLFWCVLILVLLNIVTLSSFWMRKPLPVPSERLKAQRDGGKIMAEQLGFTAEQKQQLEQVREKHFMQTKPLQDEAHKIRLDLLDEIFSSEPNQVEIENLLAKLENKQSQFDSLLFEHFQELKNTCNSDEQIAELKRMLTDLIERTRPRGPEHQQGPAENFRPPHLPPHRR